MVIFNRSYYEDVLGVPVHKLVPDSVWSKRYDLINDFPISPEEQLARFKERLDDPARHWKISDSDYSERELEA